MKISISNRIALFTLSLMLFSCQSGPNFKSMTEQELAAYNLSMPVEQRVYCYMKESISSRIPRLVCETLAEIYGGSGSDAMAIENAMPAGNIFQTN